MRRENVEGNGVKVLLGMSGGTDSSTAAMLLQEQGYEVVGVTFRFFEKNEDLGYLDAAREVADRLGIEHRVMDYRNLFERKIVSYFVNEYLAGRTPMPCAICNRTVKWPLLLALADEWRIPYVATGHYVRRVRHGQTYYIAQGSDPDKDQSFFLWGLTQEILVRALFPLGEMTKEAVRAYAAKRGFHRVAERKDSLGICFCQGDYRDFLRSRIAVGRVEPGDFVDTAGRFLGRHQGVPFYTVGQRRGLGIRYQYPIFVKELRLDTREVVIARREEMYALTFRIEDVCYQDEAEFLNETLICRIRYRKQQTLCHLIRTETAGVFQVELHEPLDAIAPGQTAVFYREERVVGGGMIQSASYTTPI